LAKKFVAFLHFLAKFIFLGAIWHYFAPKKALLKSSKYTLTNHNITELTSSWFFWLSNARLHQKKLIWLENGKKS